MPKSDDGCKLPAFPDKNPRQFGYRTAKVTLGAVPWRPRPGRARCDAPRRADPSPPTRIPFMLSLVANE